MPLRNLLKRSEAGHAPALDHATTWLNSPPLGADDLRGRVVAYDFWTYTCVNWLRTLPYLRAWARRYRDHGLIVVGVHTPEFSFEHELAHVRDAVTALDVDYPVALDNDYRIWRAFDNRYWPALYVADAGGIIEHRHFGEGAYEHSELAIQRLLANAGEAGAPDGFVEVDPVGVEVPAGDLVVSPETYLGLSRSERFVALRADARAYVIPDELRPNEWALDGRWTVRHDSVYLDSGRGTIAFRFRARDVNLVLASSNGPIPFRVTIDGNAPESQHGSDCDEDGSGVLSRPRLYQLIRQQDGVEDRTFEITFQKSGVGAYAFTFG